MEKNTDRHVPSHNGYDTSWSKEEFAVEADRDFFVRKHFWVIDLPISPLANKIYDVLGTYANFKTGSCYPAQDELAKKCNVSERSVQRGIGELETHGAVLVDRIVTQNGKRCRYRLPSTPFGNPHTTHMSSAYDTHVACANDTSVVITRTSTNKTQRTNILSSEQIAAFKAAYPKRDGDQGWKAALDKLASKIAKGTVTFEEAVRGAKAYAEHCRKTGLELKFVKRASTFVNGEFWTEYTDSPQTPLTVKTKLSPEELAERIKNNPVDYADEMPSLRSLGGGGVWRKPKRSLEELEELARQQAIAGTT